MRVSIYFRRRGTYPRLAMNDRPHHTQPRPRTVAVLLTADGETHGTRCRCRWHSRVESKEHAARAPHC